MAGTLFGIPMSQRVDLNGLPSVGWLLYLYAASTSTPVNSYSDFGLTSLNPWPLVADANGMMPQFWLADGSYRARATNSLGSITYFDQPSITAVGASGSGGGGGGGGGPVDPTTIFQTGDVIWLDRQGTRTGWVRDNGRTIGSATSGATERANADCQALFQFLWDNYSDTFCPVVTGRGGSSLADWNANKRITTPDRRGCSPMGLDDMGNSSAGLFGSTPIIIGPNVVTAAVIIGENGHTLSSGEMPSHNHTATDSGHTHAATSTPNIANWIQATGSAFTGSGLGGASAALTITTTITSGTANISVTNTGGGAAHNTAHRSALGTFYRKL